MTILKGIVALIGFSSLVLGGFGWLFIQFLNRKRFLEVCELYKKRFGDLPMETELFKKSYLPLFNDYKMEFIFNPLIFNKIPKKLSGKDGVDDREFIRNLPDNLKWWFKLEFYWPAVFLVIGIVSGVILKFCF